MSKEVKKLDFTKNILKIKNVSQFIDNNLIQCNEDKFNIEFFEIMKEGYKEMSKINLTIASESFLAEFEAENILKSRVSGG